MHCILTGATTAAIHVKCYDIPHDSPPYLTAGATLLTGIIALIAAGFAYRASLLQSRTALAAAQEQGDAAVRAQERAAELRATEENAKREHRNTAIRRQISAYAFSAMGSGLYIMTDTAFPSDYTEHLRLLQRLIDRLNDLESAQALESPTNLKALWESGHLEAAAINLRRRWSADDRSDINKSWIEYHGMRVFESAVLVGEALGDADIIRIGQENRQKYVQKLESLRQFRKQQP